MNTKLFALAFSALIGVTAQADTLAKAKDSGIVTMGVRDSSGALSYTLAGTDVLQVIGQYHPEEATNDELLLKRLAPFLAAGLRAPSPAEDDGQQLLQEA